MDWRVLTYEQFVKAHKAARPCPPDPVAKVNAGIVACRRASGLRGSQRAILEDCLADLMSFAAAGGTPDEKKLEATLARIKALGIRVLDDASVASSDVDASRLSEATLRELYADYLDSQQMFKREYRQALRYQNQ